jgi:hypothetical protein
MRSDTGLDTLIINYTNQRGNKVCEALTFGDAASSWPVRPVPHRLGGGGDRRGVTS